MDHAISLNQKGSLKGFSFLRNGQKQLHTHSYLGEITQFASQKNLTKISDKTKAETCKKEDRMKVKCGNTEVNKHKYIVTQENKETVKKLLDFLSRPPSDVQQKAVRGEKESSLTSNMDLSIDLLQLFALLHFFVMGGNTEKLKMQKQHNHYMYNDLKVQLERI